MLISTVPIPRSNPCGALFQSLDWVDVDFDDDGTNPLVPLLHVSIPRLG